MKNTPLQHILKPARWAGALILMALVLAACAPAATPAPTDTAAPLPTTVPAATVAPTMAATAAATAAPSVTLVAPTAEVTISVATDPNLGSILVGDNGMTLYIFTKDTANTSNCTGTCLKTWPPLLTLGSPKAGSGVDASMIGTATLADGLQIVTYNKMPLYYFSKDTKAGDILGQGVGSVWYAIGPDGKPIMK